MIARLTYATLEEALMEATPELTEGYLELKEEWGDEEPGPHIVFGDVLNPVLLRLLEAGDGTDKTESMLRRIFALLERMARNDDLKVQEVASTTVLDRLGGDAEALGAARHYMGDATKRLSEEVERFWNGEGVDQSTARRRAAVPLG